jgi:hypothetical protein
MPLDAVKYRYYLEDARQHADRAIDPIEKKAWLRMAEQWLRLLGRFETRSLTDFSSGQIT